MRTSHRYPSNTTTTRLQHGLTILQTMALLIALGVMGSWGFSAMQQWLRA